MTGSRLRKDVQPQPFQAYSIDAVAGMLGVSERHVRREIAAKHLVARKSGGRVLILHSDLAAYMEAITVR